MQDVATYRDVFLKHMEAKVSVKAPKTLYEPISYILHLGGKRLRPILVLMGADIFNTDYTKALDAALAIEVFHNFSLIHDDIMDDAPLRRGQATVHEKWDLNTGILSGDAMLINAYQLFENYDGTTFKQLATLFTKTAIEVCEGQQYDIDFETRDDVTIPEYLKMITYKTAVLVGAALQMGAIVAKASQACQAKLYEFGCLLGLAFQLQDDYLDTFGDPKTFGKQVGGDIIENKKTILYIKAIENSTKEDAEQLEHLYSLSPKHPETKIDTVKRIFEDSNAAALTRKDIEDYTNKAFKCLDAINISEDKKQGLRNFGNVLMHRTV